MPPLTMTPTLYQAPVPRYSPRYKESFSYTTLIKRWPVVLTNVINTVSTVVHELHSSSGSDAKAKLEEGKAIISKISALKSGMSKNAVMEPIPADGSGNLDCYNDALAACAHDEKRWFEMNWLFAECYLYRLLRSYFSATEHWKEYDPFFESKAETYRSSSGAIIHLAKAINKFEQTKDLAEGYAESGSALEIAFMEMVQADLWGNATDLSLLIDLKYEDLQKLQAVGAKAQQEQAEFILRNDLPKAWKHLQTLKDGRVDIVLDNAGFELYTDFILADFLVSCTPFVKEVVFHPKGIPWFVSDVLPFDFSWAITSLLDTSFFAAHASSPLTSDDLENLTTFASRLQSNLDSGKFRLSVPLDSKLGFDDFWTTQYAYQDMPTVSPELVADLAKSGLVIFKGDLNYRKLIGDAVWPVTTDFETALGPLAGKISLLSLRTNKADTIAGLPGGIEEELNQKAPDWKISGKYAVVSYSPKA